MPNETGRIMCYNHTLLAIKQLLLCDTCFNPANKKTKVNC